MSTTHERGWSDTMTVGDLVDHAAVRGDRDAVVFGLHTRTSFAGLAELSDHAARSLVGLGVGPGDKVGLLMPNCQEFVTTLVAAAKIGAVAVPINGRFKTHELGRIVAHADVRVLVAGSGPPGTPDYPALIVAAFPAVAGQDPTDLRVPGAPALRALVDLLGGTAGFLDAAAFAARADAVPPSRIRRLQERVRVRDVALLMYTSGTTSAPKGCLLSHEALVRHGRNVATTRFFLGEDDRFWNPLPLFHIGGLVPLLGCLATGATYFHAGHFDPDVAIRTLEEERITVAYPAFETIWLGVLHHPRFREADLGALRLIQNIAVPERLAQLQRATPGAVQVSSFGATECSSNLTLAMPSDPPAVRIDTLGHPLPGMQIRIVDPETEAVCPADAVGELRFKGYALFEGYYKEPELTAESFDDDGWFRSGDLASLDGDGRLIYAGRLKDMLKVGGENVSAVEVESFLVTHPAVDIVSVVAAPDARYDEVPAAFVQVRPGASLVPQELIAHCLGRIAAFKIPRYVRIVDEWPMSGTKIQKFVLRERIAAELTEAGVPQAPPIAELAEGPPRVG